MLANAMVRAVCWRGGTGAQPTRSLIWSVALAKLPPSVRGEVGDLLQAQVDRARQNASRWELLGGGGFDVHLDRHPLEALRWARSLLCYKLAAAPYLESRHAQAQVRGSRGETAVDDMY